MSVFMWGGGRERRRFERLPEDVEPFERLPPPMPLHQSVRIEYWWGEARFEALAIACSVRSVLWIDEPMTWLHCKAVQTDAGDPEGKSSTMVVLIPTRYVTRIECGLDFHVARYRKCEDLGVFPPYQPDPPNALPLAEIERVLVDLFRPDRN